MVTLGWWMAVSPSLTVILLLLSSKWPADSSCLNLISCSNLTINCNGNSHVPLLVETGAGGAVGVDGGDGGVTAEAAVAEIEMEGEDGPVAVDLPDIRNRSMMINDDQCNDHTNISIEHTMINDGD